MRTRRDRVERRNAGFKVQLESMADAYMTWDASLGDGGLDAGAPSSLGAGGLFIRVVDVFRECIVLLL